MRSVLKSIFSVQNIAIFEKFVKQNDLQRKENQFENLV